MPTRIPGVIYVARIGETDVVKVGCGGHVFNRIPTLSSQLRSSVTLLACWRGDFDDERRIHLALAAAAVTPRRRHRPTELYWNDHPAFQRFLASIPAALRRSVTYARGGRDHTRHALLRRIDNDLHGLERDRHAGSQLRAERLGLVPCVDLPDHRPFAEAQHGHDPQHREREPAPSALHAPHLGHARPEAVSE